MDQSPANSAFILAESGLNIIRNLFSASLVLQILPNMFMLWQNCFIHATLREIRLNIDIQAPV